MSANLEALTLVKEETLQTFTLYYFAWPPPQAGKTDTNFLTSEKSRIRFLICHTIFFTSEKNRMTNKKIDLIKERIFLFGEFKLCKFQYI